MEDEVRRLVYQNAVLETELRFARHQLLQAQNANDYLLARISNPQPAYQALRPLPTSTPFNEQTPHVPKQEQSDLLSFDGAYDSGYLDSAINSQTAKPKAGGTCGERVPWGEDHKPPTEARSISTQIVEDPTSHSDSDTSVSSNGTPKWDLKSLRKKPAKDSFGLGIHNVKDKDEGLRGDNRVPNQEALLIRPLDPRVESYQRQTLLDRQQGDVSLEPFPDFFGESNLPVQAGDDGVLAPTFQDVTASHLSHHQTSTNSQPRPQTNGYRGPRTFHSFNPAHQDRFSRPPPTEPSAFRRFSPRREFTHFGPQSPADLFADPQNNIHHKLYRSVIMTNVPPEAEVHDTLDTVEGIISTRIIKMAGMKTEPPMDTDTVKVNFESSIAAVKLVEFCSTKPFAFDPAVYLARTGTSGDFGKHKITETRRRVSYHDIDYSEGAGCVALDY